MKINRLIAENFQCYELLDLDLSNISIAGIIGQYKDNVKKSVGSGKSTIVDIILYSLFGKSRVDTEKELIMDGKKSLKSEIQFELNNNKIIIIRNRQDKKSINLELFINGKDVSDEDSRETQKKIIKLIGMDYKLFVATVFFMQSENDNFCSSTPTIRKDYLKNLLNLKLYDECYEISKEKLKKVNKEIENFKSQESYIMNDMRSEEEISDIKKRLKNNIKKNDELKIKVDEIKSLMMSNKLNVEKIDKLKESLLLEKNEKDRLSEEIDECNLKLDSNKKKIKEIQKAEKHDVEKINEKLIKNTKDKDSLNNKKNELSSKLGGLKNNKESIKKRADDIKSNNNCPTCKSKMSKEFKDKELQLMRQEYSKIKNDIIKCIDNIENVENNIDELCEQREILLSNLKKSNENDKLIFKYQERESSIKRDIVRLENEINKKKRIIEKYTEELKKIKSTMKLKNINELKEKLKNLEDDCSDINGEIFDEKKEIVDYNKSQNDLKEIKTKMKPKIKIAESYEALKIIFGKNGIISELIKNSIEEVEEEANKILDDLNYNVNIVFETSKGDKVVKDTLDIFIETNKTKRKYESFSGGQKSLINFAIRMALSRILSNIEKVWYGVIILDEVFGSLDEYYREQIIGVINYLKNTFSQIISISHTDIKDCFENSIVVERDESREISYIKEII